MDDKEFMLRLLLSPIQPGERYDDSPTMLEKQKREQSLVDQRGLAEGSRPYFDPETLMQLLNPNAQMLPYVDQGLPYDSRGIPPNPLNQYPDYLNEMMNGAKLEGKA